MPGLDGLELGRVLRRFAAPPQLVFVSAYDNAAVDAFELHALDYLLKPVGRRRVEEAIERVATAVESSRGEPPGFVRVHRQYVANLRNAVELAPMLSGTAELTFADGQTIPVARRHTAELGRGPSRRAPR